MMFALSPSRLVLLWALVTLGPGSWRYVTAAEEKTVSAVSSGDSTSTTTASAITSAATDGSTTSASASSSTQYLTGIEDVPTCHKANADLGDCVRRILNIMVPRFKDGNKELNIPTLDPFTLNRTTFVYSNGMASGRITMRSGQISGFSKTEHKSVDMKIDGNKITNRMVASVPVLRISGSYKADFSLNNVRMRPKGIFNITMLGVDLYVNSSGVLYEKDNHSFVRLLKFDALPKIGDFSFNATGIFPDPTLNELALNVVNQYWRDIYRVLLPETRLYWEPLLLRVANEAFAYLPFDAFVKD